AEDRHQGEGAHPQGRLVGRMLGIDGLGVDVGVLPLEPDEQADAGGDGRLDEELEGAATHGGTIVSFRCCGNGGCVARRMGMAVPVVKTDPEAEALEALTRRDYSRALTVIMETYG